MYSLTRGGLEVVAWRERISSGRRAPVGDWKRHGGLRESAGIPVLQQLRSVVETPGRNSPSRRWFALLILCQVVRAGEGESELTRRRSQTPAGTLIDPDDSDLPGVGAGSRWGVATVP